MEKSDFIKYCRENNVSEESIARFADIQDVKVRQLHSGIVIAESSNKRYEVSGTAIIVGRIDGLKVKTYHL